jgi:hypothetical protein
MLHFEVQIPQSHNPQQVQTVHVEAPNWLLALRNGLQQVGETVSIRNISCDVLDDQQVTVTVSQTGQIFAIREVEAGAALATPTESPAIAPPPAVQESGAQTEAFLTPIAFDDEPIAAISSTPPGAKTIQEPRPISPPPPARQEPILPPPPPAAIVAPPPPEPVVEEDDDVPYALDSTPTNYDMSPPTPAEEFPTTDSSIERASQSIRAIPEDVGSSVGAPPLKAPAPPPAYNASTNESTAFGANPLLEEPKESTAFGANPLLEPQQESTAFGANPLLNNPPPEPEPEPENRNFIDVSGSTGKYSPGMTTEILADAFMRAMEIYDYGEDRKAAMRFTIELGLNNVNAVGGCIFLTDPNDPNRLLWVEVAIGPREEEIVNFRIPFGRGVAGICAQTSTSILITDAAQDQRFDNDILRQLNIVPGSMLCVPIQADSRILGVLQLYKRPGERPFTQGELSICNYLAHIAGEYMQSLG